MIKIEEDIAHDPLCDWLQTICCTNETCPELRMGDPCGHMWCQCKLITMVRAEERWATVESAIFVASQYGCDDGLLNALNAIRGDA